MMEEYTSMDNFRGIVVEGNRDDVLAISAAEGEDFHGSVVQGNWDDVIHMCENKGMLCKIMINASRGTALHVAVSEGNEVVVNRLVESMINHNMVEALELKDEKGDTPLHLAASRGLKHICECIIGPNYERKYLITIHNEEGETPLFQAALSWQKQAFMYLSSLMPDDENYSVLIRRNGDSILHVAIRREFFDLALIIMHKYPKLFNTHNIEGFSPLKILASRPSAFKSVSAESLDVEKAKESYMKDEPAEHNKHFGIRFASRKTKKKKQLPENYDTCRRLYCAFRLFVLVPIFLIDIIGFGVGDIGKMKQKHIWSAQLLRAFMEKPYLSYTGGPPPLNEGVQTDYRKVSVDSKETVILVAARNGIVEMVNEIISKIPSAIHETNSEKKNVLLVAVENRQTLIVEALKNWFEQEKKELIFYNLKLGVDDQENTVLHLAATLPNKGWMISGLALQMMWHIKWFQYIKDLVPEHFTVRTNKDGKTARQIFKESHNCLVKDANEWLKGTSESCSVVAAFLAGVSFATSTSVPGSFDSDTGEPLLETNNAFESFAMCSLVGLSFSVTALVLFLSILTSRKELKDFRRSLPLKVLLGLGSLFISTAALFATFCSAHFFIVDEKYKQVLIVIYAVTCLPVGLYAIAQFPLFIDLVRAIATKVPQAKLFYDIQSLERSSTVTQSNRFLTPSFPHLITHKLDDLTFLLGSQKVELVIKSHHLQHFVVKPKIPQCFLFEEDREAKNPAYEAWEQQDQVLLTWLQLTLSALILSRVLGCAHSYEEHIDSILEGLSLDYHSIIAIIESKFKPFLIEQVEALLLAHEVRVENITKMKQKHKWSGQLLINIDREETGILVAARNGIVEMVNEIISKIPIENRQPFVVEELKNRYEQKNKKLVFDNLTLGVDEEECTLLHMAATLSDKGWMISVAASQMMCHIKWFQIHYKRENRRGNLQRIETHKGLVNETSEWLKGSSESCSVVAALLAGVSIPLPHPPLSLVVSTLTQLNLHSITALIMFLSILTSQKEVSDFRTSLPLKLLLGLTSLFISITALFATFCSAHFFVIDDKFMQILILIYAVTCLPVTFYAVAQFPLYIDLVRAIATKVPMAIESQRAVELETDAEDVEIIGIRKIDIEEEKEIGPMSSEDKFRGLTVEGKWEEVIKMCEEDIKLCTIKINNKRGTALHVAVNEGNEDAVKCLVGTMIKHKRGEKALTLKNERGDTPLHLAATRGLKNICECIIGKNKERKGLITFLNDEGETPFFQVALSWQKEAFWYLCSLVPADENVNYSKFLIRNNGDSILHCAIRREFFDLALIIMYKYPKLYDIQNREGFSPLKLLATRPSAFKSVSVETLDVQEAEKLYMKAEVQEYQNEQCMVTKEEKDELCPNTKEKMDELQLPENYNTCHHFYHLFKDLCRLTNTFFRSLQLLGKELGILFKDLCRLISTCASGHKREKQEDPEKHQQCQISMAEDLGHEHVPPNLVSCLQSVKLAYIYTLGLSGVGVENIRKMKQKHKWSGQLLSEFMKKPYESYTGSGGPPQLDSSVQTDFIYAYNTENIDKEEIMALNIDREETAILVAARNGIIEMVNELISKIPSAIHETNSKKKNVLLIAVENRQTLIVEELKNRFGEKKTKVVLHNLILGVDDQENTMLHLAAAPIDKGWMISGSALQMMWHIKWFQYIKELVPEHFTIRTNKKEKTAGEIFRESHKGLVKEASGWLKDTSESCSVVAALLAGVSFATSTTVPGGVNTDTGKPALEGQVPFESFAMCSLIGLCFSVTALIMFLSILTSRKEIRDFRTNLPLKLLMGLSSLFISIAALFATFCSAHFFVIDDKFKQVLILIYTVTCLPVTFYAVAQFPLYIDLMRAITTKVPLASDKGDDL
ncbi:Serine/threonine-protein phosphatase 6 regulatory ankyrin repeat subunit A [Glycine soja]